MLPIKRKMPQEFFKITKNTTLYKSKQLADKQLGQKSGFNFTKAE